MRLFAILRCFLAILACLAISATANAKDANANSVVKIYVTQRQPDFVRPWNKAAPQETGGSGAIIEGKRILTNAHVVQYASQIFVQGDQSTERVPAKAVFVAPDADLAIVEVDDPAFFDNRPPLPLAENIPTLKQTVSVYGYPIGGEQMSITQGVVSRIEDTSLYCYSRGLRIQIDAAINPGNSGGPALADGKIVGLVFSKFTEGENIGYLLAAHEIRLFLKDIEDGKYDGKPLLWAYIQSAENEALRARLGLKNETGMVIYRDLGKGPDFPLKKWDLLMKVGDKTLDNQGNVKISDDLRIFFQHFVPQEAKDGLVKLTVFRDGKICEVTAPVQPSIDLVMPFLGNKYPRYFIYGPMVFMSASQELAGGLASSSVGHSLLYSNNPMMTRLMDPPAFEGEEIVLLGYRLLPHKTSKGYVAPPFSAVSHVNGTAVRNLAHLVELLRDAKGEFLTIDLAGLSPPLVFRRAEAIKATDDILSDEGVRKQYSDDLESAWNGSKPK